MDFDLDRFLIAQEPVYERVTKELRNGRKHSHWMWFVFPQIAGLGHSEMAQRYAIPSLDDARRYLADTVLGHRLRECTALVLETKAKTAREIFGHPDDLKFHSCMTLFEAAAPEDTEIEFRQALDRFFAGKKDSLTVAKLEEQREERP